MNGDGYQYEVFISYRRDEAVKDWLRHHFQRGLQRWLPQFLPPGYPARIFVDWHLVPGQRWPLALQNNLKRSRCLLPVFTTQYFASDWCMAELLSMEGREQQLGIGINDNTDGLTFPVIFADGEHFPQRASKFIQYCDMRDWAYDNASFADTRDYTAFTAEVKTVAQQIAQMILRAPPWQDWPIVIPNRVQHADPVESMTNPRLGIAA